MGAHSAHSSSDSPHSFHPTTMSYNFYHPPTVSFQERTLARFLRRINRQLVSHGPTILHFDSASGNLRPWYWWVYGFILCTRKRQLTTCTKACRRRRKSCHSDGSRGSSRLEYISRPKLSLRVHHWRRIHRIGHIHGSRWLELWRICGILRDRSMWLPECVYIFPSNLTNANFCLLVNLESVYSKRGLSLRLYAPRGTRLDQILI